MLRRIFDEALQKSMAYGNLEYLCKNIGPRLSGSPNAAKAVEYVYQLAKQMKPDASFKQECMVPHWVRGEQEVAKMMVGGKSYEASICALGGSIATAETGIKAQVIEVKSKEELAVLGKEKITGKIVFFNQAMDPKFIQTMSAYGATSHHRHASAMRAAPYGAVAVVVRSLSLSKQDFPHTGGMGYSDTIPKIPACAISTKDADLLSELIQSGKRVDFYFKQSCKTLADEPSHNVIAELKGSRNPNEFIVVGGHLDSWDLGEGAHDDGAGVVQAMEVIRIFKAMNYVPKHSIRAVAFMNEENGVRGGTKYAELANANNEKHLAAIESDAGGFAPIGFTTTGNAASREKLTSWRNLLETYGIYDFTRTGCGTDVEPLLESGTIGLELLTESQRYFDYHHSKEDSFDKINKRELELGAAAMAALVYLIDQYGL